MRPVKSRTRTATLALILAGGLSLAACGGVTVEGDSADTAESSVARESTPSSTADSAGESTEASTSARAGGNRPAPRDEAAAEVTALPETSVSRTPQELDLLEGLSAGGVDIAGVEDQMIATAANYCDSDSDPSNVTVDAIAGQLIAQDRVDVPADRVAEVSTLIKETADRAYC